MGQEETSSPRDWFASEADQRHVIAESPVDHPVRQFDRGVEVFGILKFGTIEDEVGPLSGRRQSEILRR